MWMTHELEGEISDLDYDHFSIGVENPSIALTRDPLAIRFFIGKNVLRYFLIDNLFLKRPRSIQECGLFVSSIEVLFRERSTIHS